VENNHQKTEKMGQKHANPPSLYQQGCKYQLFTSKKNTHTYLQKIKTGEKHTSICNTVSYRAKNQ